MDYIHLTEDADGVSRFEDRAFPMTMGDFAPPAPEMWLSEAMAAGGWPTRPDRGTPRPSWATRTYACASCNSAPRRKRSPDVQSRALG
jgi:hypothetical protein